jgi:hypothetical protein
MPRWFPVRYGGKRRGVSRAGAAGSAGLMEDERIPEDAPVETPESDPRTPNAPDPDERNVDDTEREEGDEDDVTRQIGEAFE